MYKDFVRDSDDYLVDEKRLFDRFRVKVRIILKNSLLGKAKKQDSISKSLVGNHTSV